MPIEFQDATWHALAREAAMAGRLIGSGLESLRRADNSAPAVYYEAFFGLTIGLERTCKLAIVAGDYMAHGVFPTDAELKKKYGHDLIRLVAEIRARIADGRLTSHWSVPEGPEADDLVSFLTDFAKFNRYYNLSLLSGGIGANDTEPIRTWVDLVLRYHPQPPLKPSELKNIEAMADIDRKIGHNFMFMQTDERENRISDFAAGATHHLTTEHVRKEGTMMGVRLARALALSLHSLSYAGNSQGDVLPVFIEFFGILYNEDNYLKTRKRFNS